jgi:hypothetical protein
MKFLSALLLLLCCSSVQAVNIPDSQDFEAINYPSVGTPTGCGLRTTGVVEGDLWVNILLNMFVRPNGSFGMFKVVARRIQMEDGVPKLKDGKVQYVGVGKIDRAWVQTESGLQLVINKVANHDDGYMASLTFVNARALLTALTQENFKVGLRRTPDEPDGILQFTQRITAGELKKLSACMQSAGSKESDGRF